MNEESMSKVGGFSFRAALVFKGYFIILCKVSVIDLYEINNKLVSS